MKSIISRLTERFEAGKGSLALMNMLLKELGKSLRKRRKIDRGFIESIEGLHRHALNGALRCIDEAEGSPPDFPLVPAEKENKGKKYWVLERKRSDGGAATLFAYPAYLFRYGRLNTLILRGSYYEMAFQHGRLFPEMRSNDAPDPVAVKAYKAPGGAWKPEAWEALPPLQYSRTLSTFLGHLPLQKEFPETVKCIEQLLEAFILFQCAKKLSPTLRQELKGFCDGSGVPREALLRATGISDTIIILVSLLYRSRLLKKNLGPLQSISPMGCTSFIAADGALAADFEGDLVHARNLDYFPLVGSFDRFPAAIYFCPEGNGLEKHHRHLSFTCAGIHSAGITGMNDVGLNLGVHFQFSSDAALPGTPFHTVTDVGSTLLRESATLDEAMGKLHSFSPGGAWAYLVSSPVESRNQWKAFTGEIVSKRGQKEHVKFVGIPTREKHKVLQDVFPAGPAGKRAEILLHTNFFFDRELFDSLTFLNPSQVLDHYGRFKRAGAILKNNDGAIDLSRAAAFLGDHYDFFNRSYRASTRIIGTVTNVCSVIMAPRLEAGKNRGEAWMAEGQAPACNSRFVRFPFEAGFSADPAEFFTEPESALENAFQFDGEGLHLVQPGEDLPARIESARKHFREAFHQVHTGRGHGAILPALEASVQGDPRDPALLLVAGIFAMRAAGEAAKAAGDRQEALIAKARSLLQRARTEVEKEDALDNSNHFKRILWLYSGRAEGVGGKFLSKRWRLSKKYYWGGLRVKGKGYGNGPYQEGNWVNGSTMKALFWAFVLPFSFTLEECSYLDCDLFLCEPLDYDVGFYCLLKRLGKFL